MDILKKNAGFAAERRVPVGDTLPGPLEPKNQSPMKRTLLFLLTTSLLPLTLQAQAPPPPNASENDPIQTTHKSPAKLDKVVCRGANLAEIADYLIKKVSENPDIPDLGIVLSAEVQDLIVPSLNLRNISLEAVMEVISTLLDLEVSQVYDDDDELKALIVKKPERARADGAIPLAPAAAPGLPNSINPHSKVVPAPSGLTGGGTSGDAPKAAGLSGIEVLHDSPAPTPATAPNKPVVKVFAIGAIIQGSGDSRDEREKSKYEKLDRLKMGLENICAQQKLEIQLSFHADMDIIVVRGSQPDALILIAETINAMKENALAAPDPVSDKAGRKP